MTDLIIRREDPRAGLTRLLPIGHDEDGKVYRVDYGDAEAVIKTTRGEIRIPYIRATGDTRMKELLTALTEKADCRRLRFVGVRMPGTAYDAVWRRLFEDTPSLYEVLEGFDHEIERMQGQDVDTLVGEWGSTE